MKEEGQDASLLSSRPGLMPEERSPGNASLLKLEPFYETVSGIRMTALDKAILENYNQGGFR